MKRKQRDFDELWTGNDFRDWQNEQIVQAQSIEATRQKYGSDKVDPILKEIGETFARNPELERQFFDNTNLEDIGEILYLQGLEARERVERMNALATGGSGEGAPAGAKDIDPGQMTMGQYEAKVKDMTPEQRKVLTGEE